MIAGTDYKFRDDLFNEKEEGSTVPIELLLDGFEGVVYRYTRVAFRMEEDPPRMLYDYEIIKSGTYSMMTLRKSPKFNTALGLVLNALLLDAGEGDDLETGANNPKEPDNDGGLHEEGSSVSEG